MKLYLFNWKGGGYNSVKAPNKRAAIKAAKAKFPNTSLVPLPETFRAVTPQELVEYDKPYAMAFN